MALVARKFGQIFTFAQSMLSPSGAAKRRHRSISTVVLSAQLGNQFYNMFIKPFKVKSNCQLKGSDRKKFRNDILRNFSSISEEALTSFLPNKSTVSLLKVFTHSRVAVQIYSTENTVIAFEFGGQLFPSLNLLWQFPDLLYTFTTVPGVLPKLGAGADLMLPGVVLNGERSLNSYGKLAKGDMVSINLSTNQAAIAIGRTLHSSYDMYMCGGYGKCVEILHVVGDELWALGGKFSTPELGPPPHLDKACLDEVMQDDYSDGDTSDEEGSNHLEDCINVQGCSETTSAAQKGISLVIDEVQNMEIHQQTSIQDNGQEEMDKLLRFCFLKALKTSAHKVDLPMLTSTFYRLYMLPACPNNKSLDMKKSSYKKLGKFLEEMAAEKIIVQKELSKGVASITAVDRKHAAILSFLDVDAVVDDQAQSLTGHSKTGKCICGQVHSEQTYAVTPSVFPVFQLYSNRLGDVLTQTDVKRYLNDYVKNKNLLTEAGVVKCDEILARAIRGVASREKLDLPFDHVLKSILARMLDTTALPPPKVQRPDLNKLAPIDIQVATRSGGKKVTLVANLEPYGVDVAAFAKECQHGIAASTTINPLPSRKGVQLQVQGNQVLFVSRLLHSKYQVPLNQMRGLDKAPKEKKSKPKK